jgi:hypothetical protein
MPRRRPTQLSKVKAHLVTDCFVWSSLLTTVNAGPTKPAWQTLEKLPLLRTSVLIALIMLLKVHLKNLYGLTEECVLDPLNR